MSSKVKQANFRLPLEYMALIDDFARREDITKATVITRALDCMQASYDSGHGGMPVTGGSSAGGASDAELEDLRVNLVRVKNVRVSRTWASSSVVAISTSTLPKSTKLRSGNAGHVCLRVRRCIFLRSQTHYFANTVTGTSCSSAGMKATSCSENATAIWRQSLPSCGR